RFTEEQRDRIADTLRLARALGGEAMTVPEGDHGIAADIVRFAQVNNFTQIIIGKSARPRWFEILHGSVVHDLVRRSGNISVHVVAGDEPSESAPPRRSVRSADASTPIDFRSYNIATLAVVAGLAVAEVVQELLGVENVDLVFLTAIVGVA